MSIINALVETIVNIVNIVNIIIIIIINNHYCYFYSYSYCYCYCYCYERSHLAGALTDTSSRNVIRIKSPSVLANAIGFVTIGFTVCVFATCNFVARS
jgi:hypothetical protein